ncbi:hypothetical protein IV498_01650 [Paenarthrobacter sp. Z7-10]|uniref:hypothetical protein n=1 Tax=Paenarthrobacter sp. Z7-10 TaxID=2787635 RepID=UPI0022A99D70|nr:hypothetical protein [Paenarthrobacter sp. Z7-10]MCZ2401920.1 hypothetical protein [Paenarthrobacter sp. Z7-10]
MNDRQQSRNGSDEGVLGNYLHSHIVAAASGVRLFEQATKVWKHSSHASTLARLTQEVDADKTDLESLAARLGLAMPAGKQPLAWIGAQLSKVNPLNPLRSRGSFSGQLELETLETAVQGKRLLWETLLLLAAADSRLDASELERLDGRAKEQISEIHKILLSTVPERFREQGR